MKVLQNLVLESCCKKCLGCLSKSLKYSSALEQLFLAASACRCKISRYFYSADLYVFILDVCMHL